MNSVLFRNRQRSAPICLRGGFGHATNKQVAAGIRQSVNPPIMGRKFSEKVVVNVPQAGTCKSLAYAVLVREPNQFRIAAKAQLFQQSAR